MIFIHCMKFSKSERVCEYIDREREGTKRKKESEIFISNRRVIYRYIYYLSIFLITNYNMILSSVFVFFSNLYIFKVY